MLKPHYEYYRDSQTVLTILRQRGSRTHARGTSFENWRHRRFPCESARDTRFVVRPALDFIFARATKRGRDLPVISQGYTKTLDTLCSRVHDAAINERPRVRLAAFRRSTSARLAPSFFATTRIFRLTLVRREELVYLVHTPLPSARVFRHSTL